MTRFHPAWLEYRRERWRVHDTNPWARLEEDRFARFGKKHPLLRNDENRQPAQPPGRKAAPSADADAELARRRWQIARLRLDWELLKFALRAQKALHHSNLQPRVPAGTREGGQFAAEGAQGTPVRLAGPGGGRSGRYGSSFPGATTAQLVRHDLAVGRLEEALAKVRRYEANWQPRAEHVSQPGSIEGAIRKVEARAAEAEARYEQLRSGRRGNLGPSLDPTPRAGQADLPSRVFDGPSWINAYRVTNNMPDLFEHPMWPYDKGTVAVTEFNGKLIFGVNSGAPGYSDAEWGAARRLRDDLAEKHPGILGAWNRGQVPNEAFFHAEPNILFRAANENGGTLAGRRLEVQTDRDLCNSCQTVLPLISPGLGDPIVTFTNYRTGKSWLLQNGSIRRIK